MKAEIISIGTEILIGHTVNTNSTYISQELAKKGISVLYHTVIGDNESRILQALELATTRADLVLTTGGLGPTCDDISHDVIAKFLDRPINLDENQKTILENKFFKLGKKNIPKMNYRQARVIADATIIDNPIGTAIGMFIKNKNFQLASFPGVPCEMQAMLPQVLQELKNKESIISKKIKLANITESEMAQKIVDHFEHKYQRNPFKEANPSLAPYAELGDIYLRITSSGQDQQEAKKIQEALSQEIESLLAEHIYGYDADTITSVLAKTLKEQKLTISFAESCTGGLASKMLTDIPGASQYTKLNLVTYADIAKIKILKVKKDTLENFGAVSKEVATEMAYGLAEISDSDINVSITGIAGPDGASPEKPIGTIYTCILKNGKEIFNQNIYWGARPLSREQVRELACKKIFWVIYKALKQN